MSEPEVGAAQRLLRRTDAVQRRHLALGFPVAVLKKFGDDRASQLAALIAYYGFFSLFPLLLVFATVVAIVVRDDPGLQRRLIDAAVSGFPVVGSEIRSSVKGLSGSSVTLVIGIVGALWTGTAVVTAAQHAMDEVWDVPRAERPPFLVRSLRALLLLVVFGGGIVVSAVLAGLFAGSTGPAAAALRVSSTAGVMLLSVALFAVAYRLLTVAHVRWRDVVPGSVVAAVAWTVLLMLGSWLVDRQIRNATQAYGLFFAIVIGLLTWIYLGAQVFVLAAEVNVVRARHLWPRSLVDPPLEETDREVLADQAKEERARPDERIDVRFGERPLEGEDR
jgi:YihY family inner membrane protein